MGGGSGTWSSPEWISGLQNALGPWLSQNFNQQQGSYPGQLSASYMDNPWLQLVGGGLTGMLYGGQPTGTVASQNALSQFLGMPSYNAYGTTPNYYSYNYPTYNPYQVQGYQPGSNTNTNTSGGNTSTTNTQYNQGGAYNPQGYTGSGAGSWSVGGPQYVPQNLVDAMAENGWTWDRQHGGFNFSPNAQTGGSGAWDPQMPQPFVRPPAGGAGWGGRPSSYRDPALANTQAAGNSVGGYGETDWLQQQMANNATYGFPQGGGRTQQNAGSGGWSNYGTLPDQFGGSDYTGQSSWLGGVPGMVNQGLGSANSLIASLLSGNTGGTVPWTAQNAYEAMLTSKGWNDQPISQAQSALAGLQGSSPSIWGDVSGNLQGLMANGAPVNVTPQWQQMTGAMDINTQHNLANAAEAYSMGNKRFGSGAANQFGNVAQEAAANQNALLGQMTQQALEAAANRRLTATGQGAALGQMQAQLPIEQANALLQSGAIDRSTWANLLGAASNAASGYGNMMLNAQNQQFGNILGAAGLLGNLGMQGAQTLGNLGLEATQQQTNNAQQQYQNQMNLLQMLSGYGGQMQGLGQDALTRIYSDYQNSQQMPYLPYASQLAGLSQLGYNQSQWPSIVGGIGGLLGGLGDSGILGWLGKLFKGNGNGNGGGGGSTGSWFPNMDNMPWWIPDVFPYPTGDNRG